MVDSFLPRFFRSKWICTRPPSSARWSSSSTSWRRRTASCSVCAMSGSIAPDGSTTRRTPKIAWSRRSSNDAGSLRCNLSQTEHAYEQDRTRMQAEAQKRIPPALGAARCESRQALPGLWPQLPTATRKELLRCLIDKVVLTRLPCLVQLRVRIVWRGGTDTEKELRVPARCT